MEQFQFLRDKAFEKINVADHMLFMTYPIVKDPKLLLAVIENVYAGLDFGVGAILHHEKLFKRIPAFQESFASRLEMFRSKVVPTYNLNPDYIKLIMDVKTLIADHRKSPVAFRKDDKYVICSKNYDQVKTIDIALVKKYVFRSKVFLRHINEIVGKNERIFI